MSTRQFHQAIFVNCHVIQPIGCQECFNKLLSLIISMLIEFVNYFTFNCVSNLSPVCFVSLRLPAASPKIFPAGNFPRYTLFPLPLSY